ncbi:transcription termination/antitermination NusG family protein [Steroidobacter flavus]|uniref:Transcription termination/antitermination NusG family protein n=1 Tax=Steroidobacter flavus TaxID=1842136 RepID=A0ABV8T3X9_9GAMM
MLRWYLIQTKPSAERVAEWNLQRQGFETYYPLALTSSRRRGRSTRERIAALFPRYLFLRLDEGVQCLAPVRSTVGVASIVRFGALYAVVPDRLVADLRQRADAETGLHHVGGHAELCCGESVQITDGPLQGLEGIFEREAGADRVVVLLKLLGQTARVQVPLDYVIAAGSAA